ncbi:MAG: flagellar hook-basal body complex protein FliE [Planctomycetes bacterium]|nr:flagellar hook-basal body complex protein FliE [Planctomycetota bacterium]
MAAINPTGGIGPPMMPANTAATRGAGGGQTKADFAKMLKTYVGEVDAKQQASYAAVRDLVAGRSDDILPVVSAVAKADMSFKLLMGVRNKVIEAYKQTMNMQL